MIRTERIQIAFDANRRISINCKMFQSGQNECGAFLMKITSITTVLILTFAGIAGLPWPGADGVRPELLRTVDGQGFRAVPFDPSEDADETRNQSTS